MIMIKTNNISGLLLNNKWKVERPSDGYSGSFSVGYVARHVDTEQKGYVKVFDFADATKRPGDLADNIKIMTDAYVFERDLLLACNQNRLRRVVTSLDYGEVTVKDTPLGRVAFLIFEFADEISKDIKFTISEGLDLLWILRVLHGAFLGCWELHRQGIAHQDLKPSNVLVFQNSQSKVADLGRASSKNLIGPHDQLAIAGDNAYSPPELLYRQISDNWDERRVACDLYMLGGLIVYFFTGTPFNLWWTELIKPEFHYSRYNDSYDQVLPLLYSVYGDIYKRVEAEIPEGFSGELMPIIIELTNPNPLHRGPKKHLKSVNRYSLQPYISKIGNTMKKAEYRINKLLQQC